MYAYTVYMQKVNTYIQNRKYSNRVIFRQSLFRIICAWRQIFHGCLSFWLFQRARYLNAPQIYMHLWTVSAGNCTFYPSYHRMIYKSFLLSTGLELYSRHIQYIRQKYVVAHCSLNVNHQWTVNIAVMDRKVIRMKRSEPCVYRYVLD